MAKPKPWQRQKATGVTQQSDAYCITQHYASVTLQYYIALLWYRLRYRVVWYWLSLVGIKTILMDRHNAKLKHCEIGHGV